MQMLNELREFQKGDWVYLKIQPYRQTFVAKSNSIKLSARYYAPYCVEEKVGKVAYTLQLPSKCKTHPVFHVTLLKKKIHPGFPVFTTLPPQVKDQEEIEPYKILNSRTALVGDKSGKQLLQWKGMSAVDATWQEEHAFSLQFPDFYHSCKEGELPHN